MGRPGQQAARAARRHGDYARTVSWLCLRPFNHPPYKASIAMRLKDEKTEPCPLCRKMRPPRTRAK